MNFASMINPKANHLLKVFGWVIMLQSLAFVSLAQFGLRRTFGKESAISWPPSYPNTFKAVARFGMQKYTGPIGLGGFAPNFSLAAELLAQQTFIYGLGYDVSLIPEKDTLRSAKAHRLSLHAGFIIPLDKLDRHHLVVVFRPGLAYLRSGLGSSISAGFAFGLQYEYTLNSDILLSPEIVYNKFAGFGTSGYRLSALAFGFRVSFGR